MKPKCSLSDRLKVGVFYGGLSSERKISLKSGKAVAQALREAGMQPILIDTADSRPSRCLLSQIDVAFIALHGKGGEDGQIQQLLERWKLPYTGSGPAACRLSLNKALTKRKLMNSGIPTPEYIILQKSNWKEKIARIQGPLFLKPLSEGSSIGVFAVENIRREADKIHKVISKYSWLLAEKKITGREFTVGILEERPLPVIELKPRRSFYDFKAKYTKGMTEYVVPARISKKLAAKIQKLASKTHRVLGLRDMSRVDIMVDDKDRPYVLEANSIPGFTEFSLLPKAARASGISFPDLCARLVKLAKGRNGDYG